MKNKLITLSAIFQIIFILSCSYSDADKNSSAEGSEKESYRLIKLHYENASGENGLTTFEYDENSLMYKSRWKLLDGSRNSVNYYTYDSNENLIKKYREFSDGILSTILYEYDEKGNLLSEYFERSDSVTGITKYEYDENEKLIISDCQGLNGWFFGKINYEYNENGQKVKGLIKKKGEMAGTIIYLYDEHDNLIKEYWDFLKTWNQTFVYEYEKVK